MELMSSFSADAIGLAGLPGDTVTALLRMIADGTGLAVDDSPDGWLGIVASGLAGAAAALAVAIVLTVYFRTGYRSGRDIVRHGLAAGAVLGLLAFAAYDVRRAALAHPGITPAGPASDIAAPGWRSDLALANAGLLPQGRTTQPETRGDDDGLSTALFPGIGQQLQARADAHPVRPEL